MWDVKGALIQVEIGAGLVQQYSSKGFLGINNNDGKLLLNEFTAVRKKLQQENIFVPQIQCRDDNSLGKQEFIVYVGAEYFRTNIQESNIRDVIEFFVRRFQMDCASKDTIHEYISTANEYISQRRYADGLRSLSTAYFWSNLLEGCEEEISDTILQIGRILIQNNDIYHAQLCAQRADYITSMPNFYNPYLKCASDEFFGFLHMIEEDFQAADQAYTSAFNRIVNVPDANLLKISILSADLQALQLYGNYVKANQAAQLLIEVLGQSGCPDLMPLCQLKSDIADCAIKQLETRNAQLSQDIQTLTAKYNEAMKKLNFTEQFMDVTLEFLKWGILNLPTLTGSLTALTGQGSGIKTNNINVGINNQISVEVTARN